MNVKANPGASVTARLLNRARQTGDDYQTLLASYCFERFLFRLGESEARQRFVLKGAMLLRLWSDQPYRATRDLDLLRRGTGSLDAIHDDIRLVAATVVPPDGVEFDTTRIQMEPIRAEDEYMGARAAMTARCGTARLILQIDVGVGDAVWPPPQRLPYPTLLDQPAPEVLAYARDTVVAEKLEAMIVLGDRNSRIKDFFDLHYLASHFEFDRGTLRGAVQKTFGRRSTPIPLDEPVGLTTAYWENPTRPAQMRAFARRARLAVPPAFTNKDAELLRAFLLPILKDLQQGSSSSGGVWRAGGPWQ
jgi:hypothetical protein